MLPRPRAFPAVALLLLLQPVFAQKPAPQEKKPARPKDLAGEISFILSQPELARAHWGIDVMDLETGKAIYSLNPAQLFTPASNAKLLTTAAALSVAGPDYRFRTTIEAEGPIENGRLQGDLVIAGRGDPNISGRVMPLALKPERVPPHTQILEEMADQVARSGLKAVDGDVIGDDTFYSPQRYADGWSQDDLQWIDGAPVSALTFNDNVIFVDVAPGEHAGDKALVTTEPETAYFEIDNRIVTSAGGIARKVGVHRDPGSKRILLWGTLPLGDNGLKEPLAVEDPAEATAQIFRGLLERRGIAVNRKARARHQETAQFFDQATAGVTAPSSRRCCPRMEMTTPTASPTPPPATPSPTPIPAAHTTILAEHISLPFIEDVRVINKTSQNLHAELALRLAGKLSGNGGSFEGGTAAVRQFLLQAGLAEDSFVLLDGSGLSRRDLVTPEGVVQLLAYARRQPWGAAYEDSLPIAGIDGSLAERLVSSPAAGLVHAKTGTLSHVSALSGYGQTLDGRRFAFSIFCNNHDLPTPKVLAAIDAIVTALVNNSEKPR
ncbi:MAG TPA: D-alanyl-D-alanine carboxypeptidase/D-alanyl-D-alanine-endopeptidase [Candidatus Angelobacter sp.]|nr:D-alanyl-D-alanine carboxypeptidase/D-alanyl-D-alanine-endopeptidase [Candidatus Angelobacter sp.]